MCKDETKEKLKSDKLLLKLHLKYILGISLACVCLVVVLSFCEDSTFKNCISVSSTVTSIILSVIAIILSVTGERTTNEIRNKVSDSVNQLEDCTAKSSELSENLSATLQQLEALYTNMNDKIGIQIPQIQSTLNEFILKSGEHINNTESNNENEDNVAKRIIRFVSNVFPNQKKYLKIAYSQLINSEENCPVYGNDIMHNLLENGADQNTAVLIMGLMLGNVCTGEVNADMMSEIVKNL